MDLEGEFQCLPAAQPHNSVYYTHSWKLLTTKHLCSNVSNCRGGTHWRPCSSCRDDCWEAWFGPLCLYPETLPSWKLKENLTEEKNLTDCAEILTQIEMGQTSIYIVCGCVSKQSGLRSKKNSICVPVNTYKKPSVPAERGEEIVKRQTTMAKELFH